MDGFLYPLNLYIFRGKRVIPISFPEFLLRTSIKTKRAYFITTGTGSMHHELLMVLSGFPGNVFTVNRKTGFFEVRRKKIELLIAS